MAKLTEEQLNARRAAKAAKEKEQERLDKIQNRLFRIDEMRRVRTTEPTYSFSVGDQVAIGNLSDCVVIEVFDNGQFYELEYGTTKDDGYRKKVPVRERSFWHWHDLQPFRKKEDWEKIPPFSKFDESRLNFSQRTLDGLIMTYYRWRIDMSPEYQRGNVWTAKEKELLIESIFENRDIGKFVIIMHPYAPDPAPHAEILDGKQRLTTLIEFYENRWPYRGVLFNDLHWRDQNHFQRYCVNWAELNEKTTRKQKLEYFLKLNVAGVPQSTDHIEYVQQLLKEELDK